MNSSTIFALTCGVAIVSGGGSMHAEIALSSFRPIVAGRALPLPKDPEAIVARRDSVSTVRVNNARLEAAPPDVPQPSALLKFDMLNDGALSVSDVLIQVAILEKRPMDDDGATPPRVIVGPFVMRGHATIEAGYTINYEVLLRNLSSDCSCVPNVSVVSARPLPNPGS
jgi:hypothetical protein